MKHSAPLSTFALLASTALAAPAASLPAYSSIQTALVAPAAPFPPLLPCSSFSPTPCSCPLGTSYEESLTFEVVGVAAADFRDVTSDFFNIGWMGIIPSATRGPDNVPGSTRTNKFGDLVITEQLTQLTFGLKGSFTQKFEQLRSTVPVELPEGGGTIAGFWVTLDAKYIFEDETAVIWSVYGCSKNHPQNYAFVHELGLKSATSILEKQGKVKGVTVGPESIQSF